MNPTRRLLTALFVALALLAQGAHAFAPAAQHGMCGVGDATGVGMTAADCGHPMSKHDGGCDHCSQCSGGHCLAWAVPVRSNLPTTVQVVAERPVIRPVQAPVSQPARIYRPPRLLA